VTRLPYDLARIAQVSVSAGHTVSRAGLLACWLANNASAPATDDITDTMHATAHAAAAAAAAVVVVVALPGWLAGWLPG
jgi:hypothetical protein